LLLTNVDEVAGNPSPNLSEEFIGHADAARIGNTFETGGHIHTIPKDVTSIDDDVANVKADAELNPVFRWDIVITPGHASLDIDRTTYGIHRAAEFSQQPVSSVLDNPSSMLCDFWIYEGGQVLSKSDMRSLFVQTGQAAVSCYIGRQNGCEPPL
jgi:hypothetical protein